MDTSKLTEGMVERIKYLLLKHILHTRFGRYISMWDYEGFGADDRRADNGLAKRGVIKGSRWEVAFTPEGLAYAEENYGALARSFVEGKLADDKYNKDFTAAWHANEYAEGHVMEATRRSVKIVHRTNGFTLHIDGRNPVHIVVDTSFSHEHESYKRFRADLDKAMELATILNREAKLLLDSLK